MVKVISANCTYEYQLPRGVKLAAGDVVPCVHLAGRHGLAAPVQLVVVAAQSRDQHVVLAPVQEFWNLKNISFLKEEDKNILIFSK